MTTIGSPLVRASLAGAIPAGWRWAAAGGALALVISGRGDLTLLAVLVASAVRGWASVTALLGLAALALRWGSTDISAVRGAVAALGPAVRVGPTSAAVACALAGGALLLAAFLRPGQDPQETDAAGSAPDSVAGWSMPDSAAGRTALGAAAALCLTGPVVLDTAVSSLVAAVTLVVSIAVAVAGGRRYRTGSWGRWGAMAMAGGALLLAAAW